MALLERQMIPNGRFTENTWLLWDAATREAVVVDPGEDTARILAAVRHRELKVKAIWLTHAHVDHIWGVTGVREATHAPVYLHPEDRRWYDAFATQAEHFGTLGLAPLAPPEHELKDKQRLAIAGVPFEVRHVPGHSPGHVAFIGDGLCVSGDVLFVDSIGRTDIIGTDPALLMASIRRELLVLPDETRVLPGHGPETTIGRERQHNPWLQ